MHKIGTIRSWFILALFAAGSASFAAEHVKSVTAITEVFGEGQKITAVAIEFDKDIDASKLTQSTFAVQDHTISAAYANTDEARLPTPPVRLGPAAKAGPAGVNGRYAILELSQEESTANLFIQRGFYFDRWEARINVQQKNAITLVDGSAYAPFSGIISNDKVKNLVVDDFIQAEYKDPTTGVTVKYNLYVPKNYDKTKSYPLVLFIHDAGVCSDVTDTALVQGNGAVVWASTEEQAKHACFVLAPQFPKPVENADLSKTYELDATVALIKKISGQYSIDAKRLYATGQSLGCMSTIALNLKYPDFFAASYLVAGQWDATKTAALAKAKLWIVVSQGDLQAYPGMNAITATVEQAGGKVSRDVWNGQSLPNDFAFSVAKMLAQGSAINYVALQRGTVVPEGLSDDGGNNHICTWRIAYNIEGIRDWLFRQSK